MGTRAVCGLVCILFVGEQRGVARAAERVNEPAKMQTPAKEEEEEAGCRSMAAQVRERLGSKKVGMKPGEGEINRST